MNIGHNFLTFSLLFERKSILCSYSKSKKYRCVQN